MLKRLSTALAVLALGATTALIGATPSQAGIIDWNLVPGDTRLTAPPIPTLTATNHSKAIGQTSFGGSIPHELPAVAGTQTTAKALAAGPGYSYAIGEQTFTGSDGVISNLGVAKPTYQSADGVGTHTLAEMAVSATIGGKRQTVEVGWFVDGAQNSEPRVFTFNWVDGVGGCYNGCGFVQYTGVNSFTAGTNINSAVGTAKKFIIQYFNNQWWVGYDTFWIGYFPLTDWTSVNPALSTFTNTASLNYQLFGEVASVNSTTPCTDMGGGDQITSNVAGQPWTKFASVSFINTTTLPTLSFRTAATGFVGSISPQYDSVGVSTSLRTFYFGGRGWNSTGTAAGTKGAC